MIYQSIDVTIIGPVSINVLMLHTLSFVLRYTSHHCYYTQCFGSTQGLIHESEPQLAT
jgi:hypothetical protein